jgi:hypothetical protein
MNDTEETNQLTKDNDIDVDEAVDATLKHETTRKTRRDDSLISSFYAELNSQDWDSVLGDVKRQRVHDFFLVPSRLETFMTYGCAICIDALLYNFTILPARIFMIVKGRRGLKPAQMVDLLKLALITSTVLLLDLLDSSVVYHTVRGQAVLKLYVIFNVLEICDRLCCAFGHDVLDSLFDGVALGIRWIHFGVAVVYCYIHSLILVSLSTTLQVAILSHSSSLLTLLLSNQFVEIKGSVFKRFETENLFQLSCSDVVERVQLGIFLIGVGWRNWAELWDGGVLDEEVSESKFALSFLTVLGGIEWIKLLTDYKVAIRLIVSVCRDLVQTVLTGFSWLFGRIMFLNPSLEVLPPLLYPLGLVYGSEILVDWLKHSFIIKFNKMSPDVYYHFCDSLSREVIEGKASHFGKKNQSTGVDHSPLVAKRLGFVSIPITCFILRLMGQMMKLTGFEWSILNALMVCILYVILLVCKLKLGQMLVSHSMARYKSVSSNGPSIVDIVQNNIFPAPLPKSKSKPARSSDPTNATTSLEPVALLPSRFEFSGSRIV